MNLTARHIFWLLALSVAFTVIVIAGLVPPNTGGIGGGSSTPFSDFTNVTLYSTSSGGGTATVVGLNLVGNVGFKPNGTTQNLVWYNFENPSAMYPWWIFGMDGGGRRGIWGHMTAAGGNSDDVNWDVAPDDAMYMSWGSTTPLNLARWSFLGATNVATLYVGRYAAQPNFRVHTVQADGSTLENTGFRMEDFTHNWRWGSEDGTNWIWGAPMTLTNGVYEPTTNIIININAGSATFVGAVNAPNLLTNGMTGTATFNGAIKAAGFLQQSSIWITNSGTFNNSSLGNLSTNNVLIVDTSYAGTFVTNFNGAVSRITPDGIYEVFVTNAVNTTNSYTIKWSSGTILTPLGATNTLNFTFQGAHARIRRDNTGGLHEYLSGNIFDYNFSQPSILAAGFTNGGNFFQSGAASNSAWFLTNSSASRVSFYVNYQMYQKSNNVSVGYIISNSILGMVITNTITESNTAATATAITNNIIGYERIPCGPGGFIMFSNVFTSPNTSFVNSIKAVLE